MTEIKKQSVEDLKKAIAEKRVELRTFRFGRAGSRARDVRGGRNLRKEIARILTELRSRELSNTKI